MQAKPNDDRGLVSILIGDGRALIALTGLILIGAGFFASFQAVTGHFLPQDRAFLGMSAAQLHHIRHGRIVHFMIHDRISFGGALVGVGVLYLYLAAVPLAGGEAWAWWTLLFSGVVGFASFLSYLGYGYLDHWHGAATLVLLPIYLAGMARTHALVDASNVASLRTPAVGWLWRSAPGLGRLLLLINATCLMLGGAIITSVGMTTVFVPEDLGFLKITPAQINAINPRLIPLIAHDRAGFGGAVLCCGLTMLLCLWCGRLDRALWQTVLITGVAGYGTAIGVHFPIGYTTFSHLAPAYLGALIFAGGMILTRSGSRSGNERRPGIRQPVPTSITSQRR